MMKTAIVMLGAPGSGKGTQAQYLMSTYNFIQISTGDLLRGLKCKPTVDLTDVQCEAIKIMDGGNLVSNELVSELLGEELERLQADKVIFDGFPRNQTQIGIFEEMLKKLGFEQIIPVYLHVDDSILVNRMNNRIKEMKEKGETPRADDNVETLKVRLDTYHKDTEPVIEYYKSSPDFIGLVAMAEARKEEIWEQLQEKIFIKLAV